MKIVIFGLSLSSSWGNGHATTYRGLIKALADRGHQVTFIEYDAPWYAQNRDLTDPSYCNLEFYRSLGEVPRRFGELVAEANLVILGSYVYRGAALGEWIHRQATGITAFYDIDTPVTLAKLDAGELDYLSPSLIPRFHLYLSFSAGPVLDNIGERYGSPCVRPLLCSVDPEVHVLDPVPEQWALGYLGTYSDDRQPVLEKLLCAPARKLAEEKFVVAGPQYPDEITWPDNVARVPHLAPAEHPRFYAGQRFTLNVTRQNMVELGYSPSVRLFEAAACGVPVISDRWPGIETFFEPDKEILLADDSGDVTEILGSLSAERRRGIAEAARKTVMQHHTAAVRAQELELYVREVEEQRSRLMDPGVASVA